MKPLEGIEVIKLAEYVVVPGALRLLADWGVTVYKIERPQGDPSRHLGPSLKMIDFMKENYNHRVDTMVSGNRQYICPDLKKLGGTEVLHKLLETVDVFATNWRQKALDKLYLDYEPLKEKYPGLIYAQVIGHDDRGPEKDNPGYDTIYYAVRDGRFCSLPREGDALVNWPNALGDLPTSVAFATGTCGALVKEARTGLGDRVSISLYHTVLYLLIVGIVTSTYDNYYPNSRKNSPSPLNNTYSARDGGWIYLCMSVYDAGFNKCMDLIERPDPIDSPAYNSYNKMLAEGCITEVVNLIEEGFMKKDADEWVWIFKEKDTPAGKCFIVNGILSDPQAWEDDFLRKIHYDNGVNGIVTNTSVRSQNMGFSPLEQSKPIGYHTEEILSQYGYAQEQLDEMKRSGATVMKHHNCG